MGGGKQIQSGFVDFQPYLFARLHLWADPKEEMDLTFGSHRFLFGAEGAYRFLAPDFSGPSAKGHEAPESSAPPSNYIKPIKSGGSADKIAAGPDRGSIDNINLTQSEKVLADPSDGVTCPSQSVWLPSLALDKNNKITSDPELEDCADSARHQMCVIIA